MAEQKQGMNLPQERDNETAMRADKRFEYSAIVDREPLKLPKGLRKHFVPVPQTVTSVLGSMKPEPRPLAQLLADALHRKFGVEVPA